MIVVLTLLVRNEIDIIRQHIEYHLSLGINYIIVTNNLSNDGTEYYLQSLKHHPKITVFNENSDNYNQSAWVTRMARFAQDQLKADWVIHSDCDEFFMPYNSSNIKEILSTFSKSISYLNINRYDFVPLVNSPANPIGQMIHKKLVSTNIFGKKLPSKIIHRNLPRIIIGQGNHNIEYPSNLLGLDCNEIDIFHYPVRSFSQFESKILLGGNAYQNNTVLDKNVGSTWRYLFQTYKEGNLRNEYDKLCYDNYRLKRELKEGKLIIDETLSRKSNYKTKTIPPFFKIITSFKRLFRL